MFLLHWLSGSARVWQEMGAVLVERGIQCVAIDLPGFGAAAGRGGYDVTAMSEAVAETIREARGDNTAEPWLIAGHSMGGKVAAAIARSAANGVQGLENLQGIVLLSPSPPGPEPMKESKRKHLLSRLGEPTGDVRDDRKRAAEYVDENTGKLPLPPAIRDRAIEDVLRMNRTAFRAWLEHGSQEDWGEFVGEISLPALIFAGSEDQSLGPDAQRTATLPHFGAAELVTLEGAGHLAPMERPAELAEHLCEFLRGLGLNLGNPQRLGKKFTELLQSERTSAATRTAMQDRLNASKSWNYTPSALDAAQFRALRALAARVVPSAGFDVAAAVEFQLAQGPGDGWRPALLPEDVDAWKRGLLSLDAAARHAHGVPFLSLYATEQDELLRNAAAGELGKGLLGTLHLGPDTHAYNANEMKLWFEEVRAMFAQAYMAHPATMERVGFTGFADEGGFTQIRLGEKETFEA